MTDYSCELLITVLRKRRNNFWSTRLANKLKNGFIEQEILAQMYSNLRRKQWLLTDDVCSLIL